MATLKNTTIDSTGFLTLPVGTVAQRPGSPASGMIRICTDFPGFSDPIVEYYNGTEWKSLYTPVASGSGGTVSATGGQQYHTYTTVGNDTFVVIVEQGLRRQNANYKKYQKKI